jgi:hypothetical protein
MLNQDTLSGGILSTAFRGSLYTTMHYMASEDKLVAGMGNGSIRYTPLSSVCWFWSFHYVYEHILKYCSCYSTGLNVLVIRTTRLCMFTILTMFGRHI